MIRGNQKGYGGLRHGGRESAGNVTQQVRDEKLKTSHLMNYEQFTSKTRRNSETKQAALCPKPFALEEPALGTHAFGCLGSQPLALLNPRAANTACFTLCSKPRLQSLGAFSSADSGNGRFSSEAMNSSSKRPARK